MLGQVIWRKPVSNQHSMSVDVRAWPSGVYVVQVLVNGKIVGREKVLKQ